MSKVVRGIGRAVGKVVKGVVNTVKKVAKSKFGKILIGAALVYFGGAALMGGFSGAAAGGGLSGALSGAAQGVANAWTSLTGAAGSALGGKFAQAGSQLSAGFQGTTLAEGASAFTGATSTGLATVPGDAAATVAGSAGGSGAGAFTGATSTGLPTVAGDAANVLAQKPGIINGMFSGLSPQGQAAAITVGGQLTGGLAHDFNNLLTAIQLQLSGLLERHPVGDPSYEGLNEIRQTAIRAADLVRKLLAFSRKSTVRRERLDLGELVGEFAVLLRRLLREDVRLETDYGRDLPVVLADKSQLETAVMNLAVNARDAMRGVVEPGAGVVTIRTARLTAEEARLLGWSAAPTSAVALIEVSDSGPGVPPELLDKIFEPFFTTKAVNEGTGMGLATVYGIVEQAGGHINVSNAAGGGAVFRIFLPEAAEAELAATPVIEKVAKAPRDLSGAGRILFVEDEAAVRGIAARLLRQRGYEVIEAEDGEQALELAEQHAGTIDMMISDVIMPGLDGPALLKKARPYLGDAPVLFISGYAESDFSDLLQDEVGVSFLPKPLDIKTLAERVKQELHAA